MELVISTLSQVNRCLLYNQSEHRIFAFSDVDRQRIGQSTKLSEQTQKLFKDNELSLRDLTRIFVLTGPGSFTSLRIGVNFAQGLAQSLRIPLFGIPSHCLFEDEFFISLRPAQTAELSVSDCISKKLEFLKVSKTQHSIEVPNAKCIILGIKGTHNWPTNDAILRALKAKEYWQEKVTIDYGLQPKISGKREP